MQLLLSQQVKRKRHFVSVQIGGGLALGLLNQGPQRARVSSSPTAGLAYSYELSPSLRLSAGAQYQMRGGLNASKTFSSLDFGFGFEREDQVLTIRHLHYLELPLRLQVRVYDRHYLSAGAQYVRLLTSSGNLRSDYADDYNSLTLSSNNACGYTQGFAPDDYQLSLGYSYYLGKGFMLGAEYSQGLKDLSDNSYFRNQTIDRNQLIRLKLSYDLFHF